MIQRKQTIYLALAFICVTLVLFFPIYNISAESSGEVYHGALSVHGIEGEDYAQAFPLYLVIAVMLLLSAVGIALYKNRPRQLMICRINLIIHFLVAITLTTFYYVGKGMIIEQLAENGYTNPEFSVGIGYFLLIAAIPFILLAIRGIRADEQLLKSIDRIR
ncbi:MAG: DUF4293 domain-containing protein [Crocinitomicaceae bacterium]|nr:DUF4293 domain-containing protein [Crocinitomicaceae bacterium]